METPPGTVRAITPATPVRLTLRDQLLLLGVIVSVTTAAALWANTVQRDIAELKRWATRFESTQQRLFDALGVRRPLGPDSPAGP